MASAAVTCRLAGWLVSISISTSLIINTNIHPLHPLLVATEPATMPSAVGVSKQARQFEISYASTLAACSDGNHPALPLVCPPCTPAPSTLLSRTRTC